MFKIMDYYPVFIRKGNQKAGKISYRRTMIYELPFNLYRYYLRL